jgi:hypothetical protein
LVDNLAAITVRPQLLARRYLYRFAKNPNHAMVHVILR